MLADLAGVGAPRRLVGQRAETVQAVSRAVPAEPGAGATTGLDSGTHGVGGRTTDTPRDSFAGRVETAPGFTGTGVEREHPTAGQLRLRKT